MAEGLAVGQARGGLLCPRCHGGRTGERSLSVYRNEYGVGGRCHRASCPLNIFRPDITGAALTPPPAFKPRPYPYPLAIPAPDSTIWDLLRVPAGRRDARLAAQLGVLTRADDSNEIVWEVRDYQWLTRGHISRHYPDKTIRIWRTTPGPFHAYHGKTRAPCLWIVEDNVSAAQISLAGGNALALLGVGFSPEAQGELGAYLKRLPFANVKVRVALDPDAAAKGMLLTRELTSRLGYDILFTPLIADPKDLTPGTLEQLVQKDWD